MTCYTVIGARGFIGARVAASLRAGGESVQAPGRDDPALWTGDLGRVFYCAGLTGDYAQRPFEAVEAHVGLLARLLEHGRFERLVYLSSTRLYDALADGDGREDRPIPLLSAEPRHVYELSKALGENLVLTRSQGRGAVARLSYVFDWAAGAQGFLSDWLIAAQRRRRLTIESSPTAARDYIHLDDAVRALRAILDAPVTEVVNVAGGRSLANGEIAAIFAGRGWSVDFTAPAQAAPPPRRCAVARLAALGAPARDAAVLIDDYLRGLPLPPV